VAGGQVAHLGVDRSELEPALQPMLQNPFNRLQGPMLRFKKYFRKKWAKNRRFAQKYS
jgi:hypothetical protein